jgi:hypothetical protein
VPFPAITTQDLDLTKVEEIIAHLITTDGEHGLLGALASLKDARIPFLERYVQRGPGAAASDVVPASCHRSYWGYDYGMLANDTLGDCVIAAIYHAIMHARKQAKTGLIDPADSAALTACAVATYSLITGYVKGDASTDRGTDPNAAWTFWVKNGVALPDGTEDQIAAICQIRPTDGINVRRGIYEFDSVGISLELPLAWQTAGGVWDVGGDTNDPQWAAGGWGGHEVLGVSYDAKHVAVITWGGVKLLTWAALATYGSLVLAQLSKDDVNANDLTETGINVEALAADFQAFTAAA